MWKPLSALLALAALLAFVAIPAAAAPPCGVGSHPACPTPFSSPTDGFWPTPDPAMAFPTVSDADTKNGTVTSNSNSWTLTYPTNIAANDLLIAFIAMDGSPTTSGWPAGWVVDQSAEGGTAVSLTVAKKKATGSETGNFTVSLSGTEQGGWRIFRIPAASWEGTLGTTFDNQATTGAVASIPNINGVSNTPDPSSLDPINWATEDTLWFAAASADTSRTFSAFPTNYTNTSSDVSGGSTGASLGLARRANATSAENPGTFTISASDDWNAFTVAIRPAAATFSPPFRSKSIHNALVR